jgi:hypothetical protein
MKYVRLKNFEKVLEVFDESPDFHPDLMKTIFQAPDEVLEGWLWNGAEYVPPPSVELTAEEQKLELEAQVWERIRRRLIDEELAKGD